MPSSGAVLPKITTLAFDPDGSCYLALPCVSREEAEAFRTSSGVHFKFHKNSGSWIAQQGFTATRGITTKSVVIIVTKNTIERIKSLFYEWLSKLLEARARLKPTRQGRRVAPATSRAAL